tara:strand:- start:5405 stop:6412 length:1008 start_codon:yes stop_codon:yes gene_type:complete
MLADTSRTFALNIPLLPSKLYWSVLVSYLVCRILDTVEDAENLSSEVKSELLRGFTLFLECSDNSSWPTWKATFFSYAPKGTSADLILLAHLEEVLEAYWALPPNLREATRKPISRMAFGMQEFTAVFARARKLSQPYPLESFQNLDRYCYYVAGTVGELLTACFCLELNKNFERRDYLNRRAVSFGLTLQLVNIIKDYKKDHKRGVCFIPRALIEERGNPDSVILFDLVPRILVEAQKALEYVHGLSRRNIGVRLFCLWPLWLAMATVEKICHSNTYSESTDDLSRKISKWCLIKTLFRVSCISWSKILLQRDFRMSQQRIERYQKLAAERGTL